MTKKFAFPNGERSAGEPRSRNSLLRLFGSPRELLAKANADLTRLAESLSRGKQREALWALMDCGIAVFHAGDWIRATHMDHHAASVEFAQNSRWIRMSRDICNAAKHGDLTWKEAQEATFGPVLLKLEYERGDLRNEHPRDRIWAIESDQSRHSVVDVLREAIADWTRFLDQKGM